MIRHFVQGAGARDVFERGEKRDWDWGWTGRNTLEDEVHILITCVPRFATVIHTIFKEAVSDSLWMALPQGEARALMLLIGESDFESPNDVYSSLDHILRDGSEVLKTMIREEFLANLSLLSEKVEQGFATKPVVVLRRHYGDQIVP